MIDQTVDFLRPVGTDADNRNIISQFALMARDMEGSTVVKATFYCALSSTRQSGKKRISFFHCPAKKRSSTVISSLSSQWRYLGFSFFIRVRWMEALQGSVISQNEPFLLLCYN